LLRIPFSVTDFRSWLAVAGEMALKYCRYSLLVKDSLPVTDLKIEILSSP
jgi:hypothetical protein